MRSLAFVLTASLALGCHPARTITPTPKPTPTPTQTQPSRPVPPAIAAILPDDAGAPLAASAKNLARLPELDDAQRRLLDAHGFFIAPQPQIPAKKNPDDRVLQPAKHLFQVYERNDYVRFPSYVTVDLAIDLTHQYFDVVLKTLERGHLAPKLRTALVAMTKNADAATSKAKTSIGKRAALAAAAYWGTALRLLEEPADGDRPDAVEVRQPWAYESEDGAPAPKPPEAPRPVITRWRGELERTIAARAKEVRAAAGQGKFAEWGLELDLTQTRPRAHYDESGVLQRYFRAMSFLGLSSFAVQGERARIPMLAALLRSYAATPDAAALDQVLSITDFVVGEPPTTGLRKAVTLAEKDVPGFAGKTVDQLAQQTTVLALTHAWHELPQHPIAQDGPVIQPAGQRVFADTLAMSALLPIVRDLPEYRDLVVKRSMGALGAAAMLGSDRARELVVAEADDLRAKVGEGIDEGRTMLGELGQRDDAYHRTLVALRGVLGSDPIWFDERAYELRMLQSFAGGWAMLRHDTLLYAYEMGAECDAEDLPAPYGWVEPVPQTYAALRAMVQGFATRVEQAGIVEAPPKEGEDDYGFSQFATIANKTKAMTGFLEQLETWSRAELAGKPFDEEQRTAIAMVGGFAEHVLLTLADAYELGAGNDDMAIVADVFTFKGRALEVGVAHPELIYALIPTPEGWTIARGAVLGYRELFVPQTDRMTDEAWRARLAKSADHAWSDRPSWLAPISTTSIGVVELAEGMEAQSRCEYYGGSFAL